MSALLWVLTWAHLAAALGEGDLTDASLPGFATLKKQPVFHSPGENILETSGSKTLKIVSS